VLQEGEFRRVGENQTRSADLRVLAATNKDLAAEVSAGRFREDLYYRLNVIQIRVPPLRERPEDIPLLCEHFLRQAASRLEVEPKRLASGALAALKAAPLKGNVRELQNILEQATVLSEGGVISAGDLPLEGGGGETGEARVWVPAEEEDLKKVLKAISQMAEEQVIRRVLERTEGNRTRAAERLGISRRALITKIKELGLE
jgi:DNA-binding NtrC family response regulator